MVQTLNFINLSSQQAPNDVDWAGLVNSGVQGVLIRLGHGIIRDPCASGHIAKAKQYGLYWHGYHTYEGVVNEPQFTIKNATELGLSTSQYYFIDLTKSSDPFNDYYALHATWLSQGYSTGLLISNEDYLSKFTDSEVTASGTLRWLISDTEPADYDVWQYSSEGTVGTSSAKVGLNFAKTDKLKYNLNTTLTGADISKDPYNPQTPVGGAYIGWGYDTTGLGGGKTIGYSTNGKNFYALIGPDGLVVRKSDGNRIYGTIADQIDSAISANVIPAKSAADSAVAYANDAIKKSKVNSQAIDDINSAVTEAKQGANDAMSRAKSAWDVATGAKEAVTEFDPLLKQAQSDAVKALTQIADTASALSDAKAAFNSDVAAAKSLANTAQVTADNAVKSASSVADDLTAVANQAKANANGITKVTSDVGLLQTTVADNSGNISKIQETAKQIQQAVSDNAGNITVAKQTADSAVTVASDARSNATVAIQTASQASITASNASGQAANAVLTANGAMTTASNANSNATVAVQTANGASLTATNANSDATVAKQTASEAKVQASNAESDFAQLSIRAGQIEASVANNSGAIASVQQTANGLTTTVGKVDDRVKKIEDNTNWTTKTGPLDMDTLTTTQNIYYRDSSLKNADGETGWAYIQVISIGERVTQTVWHDRSSIQHTRTGAVSGSSYNWDAWNKVATYAQVVEVKKTVDGIATTINDPKTGLNATYQTASGNSTTISNVKSDVYQLQTTANGLTSRVGNLESKTNTQETAIEQNKNAIALKADQTAVDKINGTVSQLQSSLTVQAGQIQEKVTSSQVAGMLAGYATQDYTQSLVTQKAGEISESIVKLDQTVKQGAENNVQLVRKSDFEDGDKGSWDAQCIVSATNPAPPVELGQSGMKVLQTNARDSYEDDIWYSVKPGEKFDVDFWCKPSTTCYSQLGLMFCDKDHNILAWIGIPTDQSGQWKQYIGTITAPANASFAKPWFQMNKDGSNTTDTALLAKPSIRRQNATTVAAIQQITASIDGLQSNVTNLKNDTSSHFTQLSNLIATKVSQGDYNSQINQLKNDINLRVTKGDLISQINLQAGTALIQSNKLVLDGKTTIITGEAFIPSAAIGSIQADKVMLGSSSLWNSDGTLNLLNQNGNLKALIQVKQGLVQNTKQSIISFSSDYNNRAFSVTPVGATITPTLFFERYDQTEGHWLGFTRNEVRRDGVMFHTWDDEGERFFVGCHARFDRNISADGTINQGTWNGTNGKPLAGILTIATGNTIWSGSDYLAIGDHLSNSFTNVMARSFSQQSTLSSKTNIEMVDPKDALDLVNRTDIRSYQYKADVEQGKTKRYTSLIIDDVNDVSQYYAPNEFTNDERTGRDDGSAVGYLFLAVKELTRRIKNLEEKLNG